MAKKYFLNNAKLDFTAKEMEFIENFCSMISNDPSAAGTSTGRRSVAPDDVTDVARRLIRMRPFRTLFEDFDTIGKPTESESATMTKASTSTPTSRPSNDDDVTVTHTDTATDVDIVNDDQSDVEIEMPKRPGNGYVKFSRVMRPIITARNPGDDNRTISKTLGRMWRSLGIEQKKKYILEFKKEISEIGQNHPHWNYAGSRARSADESSLIVGNRPSEAFINETFQTEKNKIVNRRGRPPKQKTLQKQPSQSLKRLKRSKERKRSLTNRQFLFKGQSITRWTWVMCENCRLWRKLPLQKLPETWYCYMNPDTIKNTCFENSESPNYTEQHVGVINTNQ